MTRSNRWRWTAWGTALVLAAACGRDEVGPSGEPLGSTSEAMQSYAGPAGAPSARTAVGTPIAGARPSVGSGAAAATPGVALGSTAASLPGAPQATFEPAVPAVAAGEPAVDGPALEDEAPAPDPARRAELVEVAPNEFLVEGTVGEPLACGSCSCPTDGCGCAQVRSGGCLCTMIEGGEDCACTCGGLPSVAREVNVGSTGSPAAGPSTEGP
jgi:hypothetical protein